MAICDNKGVGTKLTNKIPWFLLGFLLAVLSNIIISFSIFYFSPRGILSGRAYLSANENYYIASYFLITIIFLIIFWKRKRDLALGFLIPMLLIIVSFLLGLNSSVSGRLRTYDDIGEEFSPPITNAQDVINDHSYNKMGQ